MVALARRELSLWWATLDTTDPSAAVAAMESFLPDLVATYGDVAGTVAADWYDKLRDEAGVRGTYRAMLADGAPAEQVAASARWAVGPLFTDADAAATLDRLGGAVQRLVQHGGRATLARNIDADPSGPRWARVPGGTDVCAWCRMLASRGAVYLSERSAGGMDRWHDDCNCQPAPVWPDESLPYDDNALYQQYLDARAKAGPDPRAITAQMRTDLGIH